MTEDLDTLLTALYVEIDDHVAPPRQGRGRRPRLTDAELVCLAVAQVLLGFDCEHRWIRFAYCRLGHLFRYLSNQPGYHKRLRAAAPLLAQAISHLARVSPWWCDSLRLIDATPLPCGASRETVNRSDIGGTGGYGFVPPTPATTGASSSIWSPRPTACPSPGAWRTRSSREREVCLDLLTIAVEAGLVAPGATVLADKGLAGRDIEQQMPHAELGDCCARTAATSRPGMAASAASDSGSSRCSTPSRANSAWSTTGPAPRMACSPASLSACSPWPPRSGATGRSTPPTSAASSPTTTDPAQLQGIDHLAGVYAMAALADDWAAQRQLCINVLTTYLQVPYQPDEKAEGHRHGEREVRRNIVRVIRDHLRDGLTDVSWCGYSFRFEGAVFDGGDLTGARFTGGHVTFHGARFVGGIFHFNRIRIEGGQVWFTQAQFEGGEARFEDAAIISGSLNFDGHSFTVAPSRSRTSNAQAARSRKVRSLDRSANQQQASNEVVGKGTRDKPGPRRRSGWVRISGSQALHTEERRGLGAAQNIHPMKATGD